MIDTEKPSTTVIDKYIRACPESVRARLQLLRNIISQEAPGAVEKISYGMPTFYLKENLVHFAAAKRHIGFYPTPSGVTTFESELGAYKHSMVPQRSWSKNECKSFSGLFFLHFSQNI